MRLSLKDYLFSHGIYSGQLIKDYSNYQYNNRFLSINYFESEVFKKRQQQNYWPWLTSEYYNRKNKNVNVKIESNYLLTQKNDDGIITIEFKNVDGNGQTINTYRIELLFNIVYKNDKADIASLEWVNITSDKPNSSIKYEVSSKDFGTISDLTEFTLDEEVTYNSEKDYKKYESVFSYDEHYTSKQKVSFENIIFAYKTSGTNNRFYEVGENEPILTIKAIGAIATDVTKIYLKDITDIKRYYRQGCLYNTDTFKGVKKLNKKLYVGTKEVPEDLIANSEKVDTGNVRLFKENNYKQAKYIESDNT